MALTKCSPGFRRNGSGSGSELNMIEYDRCMPYGYDGGEGLIPCKNPSHPHYDGSFFRDLRRARSLGQGMEMHDALIKIVVNNVILIELASNSA